MDTRSLLLSFALFAFPFSLVSSPAIAQSHQVCADQLDERVSAILDRPVLRRMRWGVLIQTQRTTEAEITLAAHDADRYFLPASVAKLLTTAAALEQHGPQFRLRTSVYQAVSPGGITLYVAGRGDPGFTDANLQQLAEQIRDRGITHIHRLIGVDPLLTDAANPTWEWEDVQAGYGAPSNGLILNRNRLALRLVPQQVGQPLRVEWEDPAVGQGWQIDNRSRTVTTVAESLTVGRSLDRNLLWVRGQLQAGGSPRSIAVAVTQPAQHFLGRFRRVLQGIAVRVDRTELLTEELAIGAIPTDLPEVAVVESAPLATLIRVANQDSNNLYAEALLRSLTPPAANSPDHLTASLTALRASLTRLGVDPDSYLLADGSGLSRRNLVSPAAVAQTLQAMTRSPHAAFYRDSLAVAGVSGTLRNSFRETPIQGRLLGKTGGITGVATLAGYLHPPHYPPLVFSILVNQAGGAIDQVPAAIDEILLLITQLAAC